MGIGTTTPVAKLDVAGDINWNGNLLFQGFPVLQLQNSLGSLGFGTETLRANNTAFFVTAVGNSALFSNTTGCCNTAVGSQVMASNTQGANNVAVGDSALSNSTIGNENTAVGSLALERNSSGSNNTAVGQQVLARNTTGGTNTAMGWAALSSNVSGGSNIAVGYAALGNNTTGNENIAIGSFAGNQISEINSNNIDIGSGGAFNDNGAIRIGDSLLQTSFFAAGIRGVTTTNNDALPVVIDSAGQLGTVSSSRRFKEDIQDMADSSRGLMQLRPVTFRYKQPYADGSKPTQYGLIAEEVAEVYPDLVARSADGQIESVKYQVLDSMLLNEVQRQQSEIRSQQSEIASQKSEIASEKSEIASQKSEIASQRELIQKLLERVTRLESARGESSNRDRAETQISLVATPHVR